jgi:hypothetical protein
MAAMILSGSATHWKGSDGVILEEAVIAAWRSARVNRARFAGGSEVPTLKRMERGKPARRTRAIELRVLGPETSRPAREDPASVYADEFRARPFFPLKNFCGFRKDDP